MGRIIKTGNSCESLREELARQMAEFEKNHTVTTIEDGKSSLNMQGTVIKKKKHTNNVFIISLTDQSNEAFEVRAKPDFANEMEIGKTYAFRVMRVEDVKKQRQSTRFIETRPTETTFEPPAQNEDLSL